MTTSPPRSSPIARLLIIVLLALALALPSAIGHAAILDMSTTPAVAAAVTVDDDCRTGRQRRGTSALRLRIDPVPNCAALAPPAAPAPAPSGVPGLQP